MSNYRLKRTTAEVAEYFKSQGCELLGIYSGAQSKMKYKCKCGNYSEISWNNFTNGKRCGKCQKWGLSHKKSLEEIKQIFKDRACEFLDNWYGGIHTKHNYRCKCGRECQIAFAGFYHQNQHCKQCGIEKNSGKNHHMWRDDRNQLRLDQLFRKKLYKALRTTLLNFGKDKVGRTSDMLGYGPKELREHITSHPNWVNVKNGEWHLDHIFPIQAFLDFNIYIPRIINGLDNIQPLKGPENISKHAKYDKTAFVEWLKIKSII